MLTRYFEKLEETTLANGLTTTWLFDDEQSVIHLILQIPIGRLNDPEGLEGISELLLALIQKGSVNHGVEIFSAKIEQVGALLSSNIGDDYISVGLTVLEKFADDVIKIFWEIIYQPEFLEKEFKRIKKEMIMAMQSEYSDPASISIKHFKSELYGSNTPAGRTKTIKSVKQIKIRHLKDFYNKYFSPTNANLVVAGSINVHDMQNRWSDIFVLWDKKTTDTAILKNDELSIVDNRIRLINSPNLSQTTVTIGHAVPGELHKYRNELALANYVIGGGNFSSRFMSKIRSQTGHTYGISSNYSTRMNDGTWTVSTTTQSKHLGDVLKSIFEVYSDMAKNGLTEDELKNAKQFTIGSMAFELEGVSNIAGKLLWLRFYKRPNSYLENFSKMISKISLTDVNYAINRYLNSKAFIISAVGNVADIREQLEKFGNVTIFNQRSDP